MMLFHIYTCVEFMIPIIFECDAKIKNEFEFERHSNNIAWDIFNVHAVLYVRSIPTYV